MKVKTKANYISQRIVDSKKVIGKQYFYIKFNDGTDDCEVQSDRLLEIPRFVECDLVFDIIQGQYPKIVLIDLKMVK